MGGGSKDRDGGRPKKLFLGEMFLSIAFRNYFLGSAKRPLEEGPKGVHEWGGGANEGVLVSSRTIHLKSNRATHRVSATVRQP